MWVCVCVHSATMFRGLTEESLNPDLHTHTLTHIHTITHKHAQTYTSHDLGLVCAHKQSSKFYPPHTHTHTHTHKMPFLGYFHGHISFYLNNFRFTYKHTCVCVCVCVGCVFGLDNNNFLNWGLFYYYFLTRMKTIHGMRSIILFLEIS